MYGRSIQHCQLWSSMRTAAASVEIILSKTTHCKKKIHILAVLHWQWAGLSRLTHPLLNLISLITKCRSLAKLITRAHQDKSVRWQLWYQPDSSWYNHACINMWNGSSLQWHLRITYIIKIIIYFNSLWYSNFVKILTQDFFGLAFFTRNWINVHNDVWWIVSESIGVPKWLLYMHFKVTCYVVINNDHTNITYITLS